MAGLRVRNCRDYGYVSSEHLGARTYVCTHVSVARIQFDPGACNGACCNALQRKRWQPRVAARTNAQHHYLERCLARSIIREGAR